jgi:hypothetical protein
VARVMGWRHRRVHKLHHTEVVLLGLHTGENEEVRVLSTVAVVVENRAQVCVGLSVKKSSSGSVDRKYVGGVSLYKDACWTPLRQPLGTREAVPG